MYWNWTHCVYSCSQSSVCGRTWTRATHQISNPKSETDDVDNAKIENKQKNVVFLTFINIFTYVFTEREAMLTLFISLILYIHFIISWLQHIWKKKSLKGNLVLISRLKKHTINKCFKIKAISVKACLWEATMSRMPTFFFF